MTLLLANWKLVVIAALAALLGLMTNLYLVARDDLAVEKANFTSFVARTGELGAEAEAKKQEDEQKAKDNLKKVQADHEKQIPTIRARAVAKYLAAHRLPDDAGESYGSGPVREDSAGIRLDDGTSKECVLDQGFIEDAAEDASKVEAWRSYCTLNNCPVE